MASKRMFAMTIIDTDAFLEMPCSTQALYFHLCMRADDDGFVGNPKRITRNVGASDDDLKLLIAKRFVLIFEDGVIVIKHWRIHNTLSANRYKETTYIEDKSMLKIKPNNAYTLDNGDTIDDTHLIKMSKRQVVDEQKTNNRRAKDEQKTNADKIRIDKISIEEKSDEIPDFDLEEAWKKIRELYPKTRKNGMDMAKLRFLDLFKGISPNQYKDLAKMIARAIDLYKKDCIEQGDESFKYCPNMDKWLTESAGYWIEQAEEYERNRNVSTTQSNK
jgi:hypothetical protein